jgi:hypothetical protein
MSTGASSISGRRFALLIATSDYNDAALRQLRAPGRDASELSDVLRNPMIGMFDVQTLINAPSGELQEKIAEFCADRDPDDHLLIYLSCHGLLDDSGRLYYAAKNTRRQREAATAVAASWLNERLDDCRARRQIVVLDCCHSGAFARSAKGDSDLALEQRFRPHGRGRVVLTASRSTEYSFEGGHVAGEGVRSVFTNAIVDGLRTGDADRDKDGLITVADLYQHVYDKVRLAEPRQSPELWLYAAEGDLLVAHSVRGAVIEPLLLPEDLRVTLESPRFRVRETGVAELAELLDTAEPGLALTARQTLEQIASEDLPRVAEVARAALGAPPGTAADQVSRELAERGRKEEQARQEALEKARRQAKEKARREARAKAKREAEEKARREALEKAAREAEEKARRGAERQAALDEDSQANADAAGPAVTWASSKIALAGWRARRGLLLLIIVPTLSLVVLGTVRIFSCIQRATAYRQVEQLAVLSGKVASLAQALETERNTLITFIVLGKQNGGRGSAVTTASKLEKQVIKQEYAVTDGWAKQVRSQAATIGSSYPPLVQQDAAGAITAMDGLAALRAASTDTQLPSLVVIQKYATTIGNVLALTNEIALGSNDSSLADTVRVLGLISAMKSQASEQGAILRSALTFDLAGQGVFGQDKLDAITAAQANQQSDLTAFGISATAAQRQLYNDALSSTLADRAQAQEQQAIALAKSGKASSVDPAIANASAAMAYPVSALRGVETQLVNSVISRATALRDGNVNLGIAFGLMLIVLTLLFAAVLIPQTAVRRQRGLHNHRNGVPLRA